MKIKEIEKGVYINYPHNNNYIEYEIKFEWNSG